MVTASETLHHAARYTRPFLCLLLPPHPVMATLPSPIPILNLHLLHLHQCPQEPSPLSPRPHQPPIGPQRKSRVPPQPLQSLHHPGLPTRPWTIGRRMRKGRAKKLWWGRQISWEETLREVKMNPLEVRKGRFVYILHRAHACEYCALLWQSFVHLWNV